MADIIKISWENPVSPERTEIVFANRFKEYGAYVIRKSYEKTAGNALIISIVFFSLCVSAPVIYNLISGMNNNVSNKPVEVEVTLTEPPPLDENEPPPPPPPPPPPTIETVKFTPPVVVDRPLEEEQPPPQEKLSETTVGVVTQDGEAGGTEPLPEAVVEDPNANQVFAHVEEMPLFPGGEEAFVKYLYSVPYPPMARENGISGRVFVYFVIEKDGTVSDVKLQRGVGAGGLDEAAVNWIKKMPKWSPGKQNGRPARVQYTVPFNFTLK